MQIGKIQEQTSFNGRAYLISKDANESVKAAVKQINSLGAMQIADFNLYVEQWQRRLYVRNKKKFVTIRPPMTEVYAAKDKNAIYFSDNYTSKTASLHQSSIIDAANQVITDHTEKLTKKTILDKIILDNIRNYFNL